MLTRTACDEAGDYVVHKVLSPIDLAIIRHDIGHKLYHHLIEDIIRDCLYRKCMPRTFGGQNLAAV